MPPSTLWQDAALEGKRALLVEETGKTSSLRVRVPPALGSQADVQLA